MGPAELENAHVASSSSQLMTCRNVDTVFARSLDFFFQENLEIRILSEISQL